MRIPCGNRELTYSFTDGEVRKQIRKDGAWQIVLPKVKSSLMQSENRDHVMAWRWEVELASARKNVKVRPLFIFEAVPGNSVVQ
jgi:hypothetical protein